MNDVVEHRHQRKKQDGREREEEKIKLTGIRPGEGRAPELDLAIQVMNVE